MRKRSWTKQELRKAVKNSFSFRQTLIKLKLRATGGNYDQVKKYITELGLNTTHFKGRGWNKGLNGIGVPRIPLEEILVINSSFQSFKLKKRLLAAKLKVEVCEQCGWSEQTPDGHIPLELDHINGNRHDNRLENLRILCPNCHSLTSTYRSRKRK